MVAKRPSSTVPSRSAKSQKIAKKEEPKKVVVDLTAEEDDPVEAADNNNDYEKEYKVTSI